MNKTKEILFLVIFLAINILVLLYSISKQVILPNRHRKGNLVSSFFIFFIGLAAEINVFEKNIFHNSSLLRHKYIKQGLIIAASFLFLISSFEWTMDNNYSQSSTEVNIIQAQESLIITANCISKKATINAFAEVEIASKPFMYNEDLYLDSRNYIPLKKYLLHKVLRI